MREPSADSFGAPSAVPRVSRRGVPSGQVDAPQLADRAVRCEVRPRDREDGERAVGAISGRPTDTSFSMSSARTSLPRERARVSDQTGVVVRDGSTAARATSAANSRHVVELAGGLASRSAIAPGFARSSSVAVMVPSIMSPETTTNSTPRSVERGDPLAQGVLAGALGQRDRLVLGHRGRGADEVRLVARDEHDAGSLGEERKRRSSTLTWASRLSCSA